MSKQDKHDEKGEKITCLECGFFYHRLEIHLNKQHSMSLPEYIAKHPGAPTISDAARKNAILAATSPAELAFEALSSVAGGVSENEKTKSVKNKSVKNKSVKTVDGDKSAVNSLLFGNTQLEVVPEEELSALQLEHVPKHDDNFVVGAEEALYLEAIAAGIADEDNIFIWGPPGAGKTSLVKQLGAWLNMPVMVFQFSNGISMEEFFGEKDLVMNDEGVQVTTWKEGIFTRCWREGYFIVFDEITAASSNMMLRLHGPLDGDALTLSDNGGMVIPKGTRTRIFATDNTNGRGDETGLFTGTSVLNEATLDRFGTTVKYCYPNKVSEVKILMDKTSIDSNTANTMVDIAQKIRTSFANDECSCTLSTRRLINWARKTVRLGNVRRAAYIAIIDKLSKQDTNFVNGVIQRFFGGSV